MDRPIWNDLAVFAAVVEAGSLAGAARQLGVSTSAVSHTLRGLEVRLGVRLINRTTRSLSPTEAGLQLLAALRPALAEVGAAVGRVQANRDRPAGTVRVNAHRVAALQHIVPRLAALREAYPEIVIEVVVQDGLVDMVAEGFDAGIRHPPMLEQDMIAVRLDEGTETLLAASPDYLARHGAPGHPKDLTEHACLSYRYTTSRSLHPWEMERDGERVRVEVEPAFVSSDSEVLLEAAAAGLGIVQAAWSQAERYLRRGELVPVLPGWGLRIPPNYLYYAGRAHMTPALRLFIDAMMAPVPENRETLSAGIE